MFEEDGSMSVIPSTLFLLPPGVAFPLGCGIESSPSEK